MGKYLVGIDEGTTGCKTCIFDFEGNMIGSDYREYPCYFPKPGWVEQDGDEITAKLFDSCKAAIAQSGVDPKEIVAMALSTQGAVWGPLDKNGNLLRPFLGWQDSRGLPYTEQFKEGKYVSAEKLYAVSGFPVSPATSISKYLWYKDNEPELFEKTAMFALHQEYFLKEFGAQDYFVTDAASASRSCLFDVDKCQWSDELFEATGMDKSKFPRIVNAGQPVGKISKAVAEQTGLAEGTLICVGAMDQNCSTLGGGLIEGGSAVVVMGTYGAVFMCVDEPTRDPNGTLIIKNNAGMGNYTFEAASLTAASSYRWYRDVFCSLETALGKDLGEDAYDLINREIERVAPGANGITFLPYLQGAACGPRADPYACGCILGANLATTKPELARAVMEGVTLEMRDNVESVRRLGFEIKDFRMTGGAIKSKLWNQMQADIYMAPVSVLQTSETGCLGAAMYAGVGAGIYKDFKEAAQTAVHISDSYEPNPATFEAYNAAFERFVCAYESLNKGGYFKLHSK